MALLDRITAITEDENQAAAVLGVLFMAIRFTMEFDQFQSIQTRVPEAEAWIRDSMSAASGRTGEVVALTDPATVWDRIQALGCTEGQIHTIGAVVNEILNDVLDRSTLDGVGQEIPVCQGEGEALDGVTLDLDLDLGGSGELLLHRCLEQRGVTVEVLREDEIPARSLRHSGQ